ncbi:MAG: porin family protein [Pseudomonadota bacterium]
MLRFIGVLLTLAGAAPATAQDFGGYAGLSVGYSFLQAEDGDGLATDISALLGVRFTPEVSLEAELKRSGSFIAVSSEGLSDFETTNLTIFGRYTIDPDASGLFVRGGISTISIEQTEMHDTKEETGTGFAFGAGMQFEPIDHFYVRPEITIYQYPDVASGSATFGEISIGAGVSF